MEWHDLLSTLYTFLKNYFPVGSHSASHLFEKKLHIVKRKTSIEDKSNTNTLPQAKSKRSYIALLSKRIGIPVI